MSIESSSIQANPASAAAATDDADAGNISSNRNGLDINSWYHCFGCQFAVQLERASEFKCPRCNSTFIGLVEDLAADYLQEEGEEEEDLDNYVDGEDELNADDEQETYTNHDNSNDSASSSRQTVRGFITNLLSGGSNADTSAPSPEATSQRNSSDYNRNPATTTTNTTTTTTTTTPTTGMSTMDREGGGSTVTFIMDYTGSVGNLLSRSGTNNDRSGFLNGGVGGSIASIGNMSLGDYVFGGLEDVIQSLMNQGGNTGPPPASENELEKLKEFIIDQDNIKDKEQCSICMEDWRMGDRGIHMDCNHAFHKNCLIPWLELHNSCPCCRKPINKT